VAGIPWTGWPHCRGPGGRNRVDSPAGISGIRKVSFNWAYAANAARAPSAAHIGTAQSLALRVTGQPLDDGPQIERDVHCWTRQHWQLPLFIQVVTHVRDPCVAHRASPLFMGHNVEVTGASEPQCEAARLTCVRVRFLVGHSVPIPTLCHPLGAQALPSGGSQACPVHVLRHSPPALSERRCGRHPVRTEPSE